MSNSTVIKFKRTTEQLTDSRFQNHNLTFGEPTFVDNNPAIRTSKCNSYLVLGSKVSNTEDELVKNGVIFKGFWDISKADSLVFYKANREGLVSEDNNPVYADKIIVDNAANNADITGNGTKYFLLCQPQLDYTYSDYRSVKKFDLGDAGIYINENGALYGAAWNDYAETRKTTGIVEPGDVVCENGDGTLSLCNERLQSCPNVVSDTYGVVIGDSEGTPLAVSGRVLVKIHDENYTIGDCVCAGLNGEATVMTRDEIKEFPDRILGIITEIPKYEEWNGVKVNNRVWIKIR